ncbi:TPA: RHS repeat-associated core domain-containing protein [Candidatus Scatousia excrementigallinarum]|uniref:RHS repeat-associated core domain-containing protein n=1 Tax=Candidatus Scatousia excrementigallinarum TaxID=2840935 RepID=A0A9D1EZZ5_9BACT|nr:RHS repeat-associated core domain-containing protein [Candidatus Scatousia excrementigallinarum]
MSYNSNVAKLNPFRYRGYYYDTETGLYYLNSRYYDPSIGRFINADDISYIQPTDINGLNLFAYCGNNPVMYIDPSGNIPWWGKLLIGLGVVLIGAALTAVTAGTGAGVMAAFGSALLTSAKAVAISTTISAGIGAAIGGLTTGTWDGALNGLIDGAVDGFMWGGIFAGGAQILSAGFKGLAKLGMTTGRHGGIAKTGFLSPDKLRKSQDIAKIAQRGQKFYDYGGTIFKFGKYAHIDVSTKSFLHLHLWFTELHLPFGTVLAGIIGGF